MNKSDKTNIWIDSFPSILKNTPFQFVETYNSLRTNIQFACVNKQYRRIVITSSVPGEGKSTVAINLAIALANAGSRVLLIDCDLRKPALNTFLQISNKTGLTNALMGVIDIDQCIYHLNELDIDVIPSGPIPPNPAEMLGSAKMSQIIESISSRYEYILFDTPPVSMVTDAAVLSKLSDGVVFVIRHQYTTIEAAQLSKSHLDHVGATVIGTVLNKFVANKKSIAYGGYHKYGYARK